MAPACAAADKAVGNNAGKDEHHGDQPGEVCDELLGAEANVLVVGCG